MPEEKKPSGLASAAKHSLVLEHRRKAAVTGVLDVISFDEETVITETEMGVLILRGNNLRVSRLNLERGELDVDGEFSGVTYEDHNAPGQKKGSMLGRLFR